ncbi:MAG TPA: isochorismatase family cysteine hydrolase [Puia sp.]|nr:isochorismatase family cysteine hydrolase [Puia sp.]
MEKTQTSSGTALLVMDILPNLLVRLGDNKPLLASLVRAIAAARAAGIPVIYAGVAFRKGFPEISPDNKSFSAVRQNNAALQGLEEPYSIHPDVAPQPGDILVTKRRVSAFTGSDLEVVLRSMQIRSLVLTGYATSGVVLSTLREAADKDFGLTVLSDGCADTDAEVHQVLLTKVFTRQASVQTVQEWMTSLGQT